MIICISGTPGTGKTTLGKELAEKLNFYYIDANIIIDRYELKEGFDKEMNSYIVDTKNLEKSTFDYIKKIRQDKNIKNFIIDSHMSHHFSKDKIDLCIICTCDLKELKLRLENRKYKETKVKDNLDVEIFETCLIEAEENGHNIIKFNNKSNIKDLISDINKLNKNE